MSQRAGHWKGVQNYLGSMMSETDIYFLHHVENLPMNTLPETILRRARSLPEGGVLSPKELTYDIRKLIPNLIGNSGELPHSRSQTGKWTKAVRHRLPEWITTNIRPVIETTLTEEGLQAQLELSGKDNDKLHYPTLAKGTGYSHTGIRRSSNRRTTRKTSRRVRHCRALDGDRVPHRMASGHEPGSNVLGKATTAHVFCVQGRLRGERYAQHWHDLAAISRSQHFTKAITDRAIATMVAHHKSHFFMEKDKDGQIIDYTMATTGRLKIVPEGDAKTALAEDYEAMLADDVMVGEALSFDALLDTCAAIETKINKSTTGTK